MIALSISLLSFSFDLSSLVVGLLGGGELSVHAVECCSTADEDSGDEEDW